MIWAARSIVRNPVDPIALIHLTGTFTLTVESLSKTQVDSRESYSDNDRRRVWRSYGFLRKCFSDLSLPRGRDGPFGRLASGSGVIRANRIPARIQRDGETRRDERRAVSFICTDASVPRRRSFYVNNSHRYS